MLFGKKHPIATIILPVIYPVAVEINTPFDIRYVIKNTGNASGRIWAHLLVNNVELPNSRWTKTLPVGGTTTATYHHIGITQNTTIRLEAGY